MPPLEILAIDCDPRTIFSLESGGATVRTASFGYADGHRYCGVPPHEVDMIVFDLSTPACYDMNYWGAMAGVSNSNYRVTIVPPEQATWETQLVGLPPNRVQRWRYAMVDDMQITHMNGPSPFGPADVRRAIEAAGVPLVMFLNPSWALRVGRSDFPNVCGFVWRIKPAKSSRIATSEPMTTVLAEVPPVFPIATAIDSAPRPVSLSDTTQLATSTLVEDRVGNVFGQVAELGAGRIWLLPPTEDNGRAVLALTRLLHASPAPSAQAPPTGPVYVAPVASEEPSAPEVYDVFISHASEDKVAFVEPLAKFLRAYGVKVWYDRFIFKPGDSISGRIDEGLSSSRYGVVVLSPAFFEKRWTDAEYRALLALQNSDADGRRRIIPVWHGVTREDIAKRSPLLLDTFAIDSKLGIESAGRQIISSIRPDLAEALPAEATAVATPFEAYDLAPYQVGDPGVPVDALPWKPYIAGTQPCIEVRLGEPNTVELGQTRRWAISCVVTNVGAGAARGISFFLPWVGVVKFDSLLPGVETKAGVYLDDRRAFWNDVKMPAQIVIEYEDTKGFTYRQYGTINQERVPSGAFNRFSISAIGKPFLVRQRINQPETPAGWLMKPPA